MSDPRLKSFLSGKPHRIYSIWFFKSDSPTPREQRGGEMGAIAVWNHSLKTPLGESRILECEPIPDAPSGNYRITLMEYPEHYAMCLLSFGPKRGSLIFRALNQEQIDFIFDQTET